MDSSGVYGEPYAVEAMRLGELRQAAGDGLVETSTWKNPMHAHAFGALGELLAADYVGLPWSCLDQGTGRDAGYDFVLPDGRTVDVKTRDVRKGNLYRDLVINEHQSITADVVVLVWIEPDRHYTVVGWTTAAEFATWRKELNGLWVMKYQLLHPMHALVPQAVVSG